MTNADHIAEEGPRLELNQLWMLPLILFQMICSTFAVMLSSLQEMRRTRPLPRNWQDHLNGLRESEWPVMVVLAEGARQILEGKDLTLTGIPLYAPPEDFLWSAPTSADATQLRFEWLARFHTDPARYVRRHAQRILAREAAKRFGLVVAGDWLVFTHKPSRPGAPIAAQPTADRIRAPP